MGGYSVDRRQDRLHSRNASPLDQAVTKSNGDTKEPTGSESERIKALEREVRELRQANEILRKASAYFAQAELDRRFKP